MLFSYSYVFGYFRGILVFGYEVSVIGIRVVGFSWRTETQTLKWLLPMVSDLASYWTLSLWCSWFPREAAHSLGCKRVRGSSHPKSWSLDPSRRPSYMVLSSLACRAQPWIPKPQTLIPKSHLSTLIPKPKPLILTVIRSTCWIDGCYTCAISFQIEGMRLIVSGSGFSQCVTFMFWFVCRRNTAYACSM